ncbi:MULTISPECIES: methionyl-tRNA formyltransferase [unclassified Flavobacterium]|uniref:methionyl-tRNA formyltransferase n=1 Tax=unclassified Flavobacterium TaxID=196869 RepID=UPI001F130E15|nr:MULTISPECIES: methionyl-tRNA formyltransferase [unclassified Flavobacterium]UMY65778.1 methionyl-tRNA formyltransferase [Flavobacterium sp. HJ-32-4]
MDNLRIVFMGTPEFATGILDAIRQAGYEVVAVVTAPDRPAGRGQKLHFSHVKEYALEHGLPVLQPLNLKDEAFREELAAFQADIQVVVAFRMLPKAIWALPPKGTFNLHASLLPDYRGAAPINWALINGETATGVTTFFIDEKIDTGAIILSKETTITHEDNAGTLHDRLMALGKDAVVETLRRVTDGSVTTTPQPMDDTGKNAPKLTKENTRIDWQMSGEAIRNLIRGLSPYPAAWTLFTDAGQEWNVKIYEAEFEAGACDHRPGTLVTTKKDLRIAVTDGYLRILSLQFPGKKKMTVSELLNGIRFSEEAFAL